MEIKYHFDLSKVPTKLNPQQKQMVDGLKAVLPEGHGDLTKDEIISAIAETLVTKQDHWLIFKYYQPGFIESGMILLEKQVKPKPERKASRREETVTLIVMGPPRPPEVLQTVEELSAAGW